VGERLVYVLREPSSLETADTENDLAELWGVIWDRKWLIAAVTAVFVVVGVSYALLATQWFRADVLLAPAEKQAMPAGLVGQLSGLASIAGLSVGASGTPESVAVLKSRDLTRSFIVDLKLMDVLLQGRSGIFSGDGPPDIRDAEEYFNKRVRTVTEDKKTGLVTLAIEWKDPVIAAQWANLLAARLNDRMREKALIEAERNVKYLQQEMIATSVVPLQQSLGRLLESEMQKLMLARGNKEFAFKVVDQAAPPKRRSSPQRTLVVGMAFALGAILTSFAVLARHYMRQRK
jgi:uncharacterized protein involved in exopolysaccharide biosynthesis